MGDGMTGEPFDPSLQAARVVRSIRRIAAVVRGEWRFDESDDTPEGGWWVLAVGEPYGERSFPERDQARDRLRRSVDQCGVELAEHVWVWDETDQVQLVLATLPTKQRAESLAERYRSRGLSIRVAEVDAA